MKKIQIYVAAHKPAQLFGDKETYQFIHVGAAQHSNVRIENAVRDDAAEDNISDKNDTYCELTGLYYMWKNVKNVEYIGLSHYRRFFVYKDAVTKNPGKYILKEEDFLSLLENNDLILAKPTPKKYAVGGYFKNPLDVPEFCIYRNILPSLKDLYPDYVDNYYKEFFNTEMSMFNMMVCKKALFDEYCEFLFGILFDAEERWKQCGFDVAPREMGYISEYLLNCWVHHHKDLRVAYRPVMMIEDQSKLGFKVHHALYSLGLNCLNPAADWLYAKFIKKCNH